MDYCPKCRSGAFAQVSANQFRCANCDFTYFQNVAAAVAAIIICEGEVLFNVRAKAPKQGMLDLPGGFVDPGEGLEQALVRELKEELGLEINRWEYLCSYPNTYPYKGTEYFTSDSVFVVELAAKPELVLEEQEVSSTKWLKLADIDVSHLGFESLGRALQLFLNARL
ncbi:NUDIX hydrolase [Aliagarivorans marinus]|uniref:NUDIX hydrolase n=1 Tax=Aliagarivorans marinus TaxID=561965 RepID=UPI00041A75F7|nr:NUDIX domain-containing protein [Aliagarivorans marinus]